MDSTAKNDPTIVRSRPVLIDLPKIPGPNLRSDTIMSLGLFTNVTLRAVVERIETRASDDYTLFGRLDGKPGSNFDMVVRHGVVMAHFRALGEPAYQIRYLGQGVHVAREIDESKFPPCGTIER